MSVATLSSADHLTISEGFFVGLFPFRITNVYLSISNDYSFTLGCVLLHREKCFFAAAPIHVLKNKSKYHHRQVFGAECYKKTYISSLRL